MVDIGLKANLDEGPPNLPLCKVVQREERVRGRRKENKKKRGGEGKDTSSLRAL